MATKLVSAYFKLKGTNYLRKITSNLIKEVCRTPFPLFFVKCIFYQVVVNGCRLEVDPDKIEVGDELKANQERLQFHCRVLMVSSFSLHGGAIVNLLVQS